MKHLLRRSGLVYSLLWLSFRARHGRLARNSAAWFRRTKNLHAGHRGFVIGNGPSLRTEDLDRLKGEVCIASNKIYLAFKDTQWRPRYLTCVDKLVWSKIQCDLTGLFDDIVTINTVAVRLAAINVVVARHLGGHDSDSDGFSLDCRRGVYGGRTVTFTNLQLAAHLGLNPIYLIGCDHYYQGESSAAKDGSVVTHASGSNHFAADYRVAGEMVNSAPIEEMNQAFLVARRVSSSHHIQIMNATRGGHLEAFPRVAFDGLFDG